MKKIFSLIVLFTSLFHNTQAQILNADFEEWDVEDTVMYSTGSEIIYKPRYWSKLAHPEFNELLNYVEHSRQRGKSLCLYSYIFGTLFPQTSMFVYGQTESFYSRRYEKWLNIPNKFYLAGMPFTGRPRYFGGIYIQWQEEELDSALAQVILRKYNPIYKKSDTVGIGKRYLLKTTDKEVIASDFKPFYVEIDYISNDNPDTISIVLASNKNLPEKIIKNPNLGVFQFYNLKTGFTQLLIDSLYLTDKIMSITNSEGEGLKVWYNKESKDGGYLYILSEREQQLETKTYSSEGKISYHLPDRLYLRSGINRYFIQRSSSSEILFLQLLHSESKLPIGSMKIY